MQGTQPVLDRFKTQVGCLQPNKPPMPPVLKILDFQRPLSSHKDRIRATCVETAWQTVSVQLVRGGILPRIGGFPRKRF